MILTVIQLFKCSSYLSSATIFKFFIPLPFQVSEYILSNMPLPISVKISEIF